jgi:HlyD family secretion protein
VLEGPRPETIAAARAQVARAEAGVRLGESARLELRRRQQEMEARKAEIERARAQIGIVGSQLEDTVAMSPINGVVLVKAAEPGEVLSAGTTIATIGDLHRPWVRGYINEPDLGRVKLGSKAKITTDSYPGKEYWGRVSFIASEAEVTPKQIQTPEERVKLVYRIKIDLENPNQELKSNMPVDAVLLLADES